MLLPVRFAVGLVQRTPGLTSGDCEETVGFEHDVLHTPMDHSYYPATFGAWSENPTNSDFFKQTCLLYTSPSPRDRG